MILGKRLDEGRKRGTGLVQRIRQKTGATKVSRTDAMVIPRKYGLQFLERRLGFF